MSERMPLTGDDLRRIADATDAVNQAEGLRDQPLLGRVEVYQPDGNEVIGYVQRFDEASPEIGWGYVDGGGER